MNILWVSEYLPPSIGGVQQYVYQAILNIVNHKSVVVTRSTQNNLQEYYDSILKNRGHKIYRYDEWPDNYEATVIIKSFKLFINLLRYLIVIINKENISIVIFGNAPCIFLYMLGLLKLLTKSKFVLLFHGEDIPMVKLKSNPIRRILIKLANLCICNSNFTLTTLKAFCSNLELTTIVNPGVEDRFFEDVDLVRIKSKIDVTNKRVIYTVGRLQERKGHDLVIKALPTIIKEIPNVLYLIGGIGKTIEQLKQLVSDLELNNYVKFCGFISEEDIVAFHHLGEIFIMPNRVLDDGDTEGFGIVFLEANACGKPVIAGSCGGTSDAVVQGVTGYLVNPYEIDELSERIIYLLSNPAEAVNMGLAGKERAWAKFRWSVSAKKIEDAIMCMQ